MRIVCLLVIAVSLLSASLVAAEAPNDAKNDVIHVGGKVLCQDCTQGWNEWVNGAKPLKGSRVSVMCRDVRKRVVYYGSDITDETGVFEIMVSKYVNGKELDPKNCFVRLVSSPDPVCNVATDFAGGKSGVKLHRPTVLYRDIIKYALGNLYYTTPMCDEPDTTAGQQPDENGGDEQPDNNNSYASYDEEEVDGQEQESKY